jgi:hypothetical protein
MATDTVSPLRQRMTEDMSSRKLCAGGAAVAWPLPKPGGRGRKRRRLTKRTAKMRPRSASATRCGRSGLVVAPGCRA